MTPLAKALKAYSAPHHTSHRESVEDACRAYVAALSEDEATVEKVARVLSFESIGGKKFNRPTLDPMDDPFINGNWHHHADEARTALRTLAGKEPT